MSVSTPSSPLPLHELQTSPDLPRSGLARHGPLRSLATRVLQYVEAFSLGSCPTDKIVPYFEVAFTAIEVFDRIGIDFETLHLYLKKLILDATGALENENLTGRDSLSNMLEVMLVRATLEVASTSTDILHHHFIHLCSTNVGGSLHSRSSRILPRCPVFDPCSESVSD